MYNIILETNMGTLCNLATVADLESLSFIRLMLEEELCLTQRKYDPKNIPVGYFKKGFQCLLRRGHL